MRYLLSFVAIVWLEANVNAQVNGWSNPVLIDSTKGIGNPIMAVSSKGQIAVVGGGGRFTPCPLYISDDNGKSFQLRYLFQPETFFYETWYPNGIAYDSNNVLWVYWAWDECSDNDCTFSLGRWLYLSRSIDNGKTFEHVLQLKRGFQMGIRAEHEQWMVVGNDNTIHLLRDTAWYNSEKMFTEFNLIYTKLPEGDVTKREDIHLPLISDSVELSGGINFCVPKDKRPLVLFSTWDRNESIQNYLYTKLSPVNQFLPYATTDSTSGTYRFVNSNSGNIYMNYFGYNLNSNVYTYLTKISSDNGATFGESLPITQQAYYVSLTDSSYLYSITYPSVTSLEIWLYIFADMLNPPIDSVHFGKFQFAFMTIDKNGGKYLILSSDKQYFIGRDIITNVLKETSKKNLNNIQLFISPNPFNNSTTLSFNLPQQEKIHIAMYDIAGRKVEEIQEYNASAGENKIILEGEKLASGAYVVTLQHNNVTYFIKALLVK